MRKRARKQQWAVAAVCAGLAALSGVMMPARAAGQATVTSAEAEWRQDLTEWRTRREQQVSAPDGWLTLVGVVWLKPGANAVGAAPDNAIQIKAEVPAHIGLLIVSGKTVQLMATMDGYSKELMVDGKSAADGALATEGGRTATISFRGVTMEVMERGERFVLRIKDADSAARKSFHGLNWYAPNPDLSVEATWTPYTLQRTESIPTAAGAPLNLPSPGEAQFTLNGQSYTLEPVLESAESQTLFFILSDQTSKDATFDGGRYLHAPFPSNGLDKPGKLILDFNRLENPACAYTTAATCPLPPEKNRLPVAIEAGEKRFEP